MISIVIPTLNEEKVIGDTLRKLKGGLVGLSCELFVSDGGSKDRTVQIAKRYADRVIVSKDKRGTIGKGRNDGAAAAKGEYLLFLDADMTLPHPDAFLREAVSVFEKDIKVVAVTVLLKVLPEYATLADRFFFGYMNMLHTISNNVFHIGMAPGEFQMIRSAVFKKLGGYKETLAASEDYELFGRLSREGRTRMVRSLTAYHTGRRAHAIGWPKLLVEWFLNAISVVFLKRSASKKWEPIR